MRTSAYVFSFLSSKTTLAFFAVAGLAAYFWYRNNQAQTAVVAEKKDIDDTKPQNKPPTLRQMVLTE